MPLQQQAYQENQEYQQNEAAFEEIYPPSPPRQQYDADPDGRPSSTTTASREHSRHPTVFRDKLKPAGGPLAGAAGGALVGAALGQKKGYAGIGTIGGMVAGGLAGKKIEKSFTA